MHRLYCLTALLPLAAALLTTVCAAQPETPGEAVCGGRLHLAVPQGWRLTSAGEAGAVLRSDDPQLPPIEIVGWDVPRGGEPSPTAAASAQETLLFHTGPYARSSAVDYKTLAGVTGLLVTGQVKMADDKLQDAVFAAFAAHGRFYIVGTFAPADTGAKAVEGAFGAVLGSLSFLAATPVATVKRPTVEPQPALTPPVAPPIAAMPPIAVTLPAQPAATSPAATVGPQIKLPDTVPVAVRPAPTAVTPATPLPPVPPPKTRYESPLGFSLERPAGWAVTVKDGHLEIASPLGDATGTPGALAVIWPLTAVAAEQDPAKLARHFLSNWELTAADAATLTARLEGGNRAILTGMINPHEAPRRLVACCETQGDSGLLTLLLVRPEDAAQFLPQLAGILGSFTAGPCWTAEPNAGPEQTLWHEPSGGLLQVPVPVGWKVRGGTQNFNGTWSLYLELTSNDPRRLTITWQQPVVPLYRELTPVLRNLGWQEGDKYVANPGDQALRILSRLSPQDFLTRQWLANGPLRLQEPVIDKLEVLSEPPALLNGANQAAVSALVHGSTEHGARQRYCLVATGDAPTRIGANSWQAAVLQAEAPSGALDEALAALRSSIGGAGVSGASAGATGLLQLIRGAQEALRALPSPPRPREAAREVLPNLGPRGKGVLWLMPPQALTPWQQAAHELSKDDQSAAGLIPELRDTSWK